MNKGRKRKKRRRLARILKEAMNRRLFKSWKTPSAEVLFEVEAMFFKKRCVKRETAQ